MSIDKKDTLDTLLAAAAKKAMAQEIEEYGKKSDELEVPESLRESIGRIISKQGAPTVKNEPARRHIGLRRRILIAACVAAITVSLALAGIASRGADSARPVYNEENGVVTLSFDTKGLSPNANAVLKTPTAVPEDYELSEKHTEDGIAKAEYISDVGTVSLEITRLAQSTEIALEDSTGVFEILVNDKYSGIATTLPKGSAVVFNDGSLIYSLKGDIGVEALLVFAEGLFAQ